MSSSYLHRSRRHYRHAVPVVWYKDFSLWLKILPPIFLLVVSSVSLLVLHSGAGEPIGGSSNASGVTRTNGDAAAPNMETNPPDTESINTAKSDVSQSNTPESVISDWKLILVNTEFPLPDDYTPPELVNFGPGQAQCDARVKDELERMLQDAADAGHKISVLSDYRSVEKQTQLFENKTNRILEDNPEMGRLEAEAEAAKTVAYPGTSEHHTGLAFDIASEGDYDLTERFAQSEAYQWLKKHCAEYGFIVRYPEDKVYLTGINYEPWHYRYVGKAHAMEMERLGFCLEEYIEYLTPPEGTADGGTSAVQ